MLACNNNLRQFTKINISTTNSIKLEFLSKFICIGFLKIKKNIIKYEINNYQLFDEIFFNAVVPKPIKRLKSGPAIEPAIPISP